MRVLICGGREVDQNVLTAVREWVAENCSPGDVVILGAARGVDTEATVANAGSEEIRQNVYSGSTLNEVFYLLLKCVFGHLVFSRPVCSEALSVKVV